MHREKQVTHTPEDLLYEYGSKVFSKIDLRACRVPPETNGQDPKPLIFDFYSAKWTLRAKVMPFGLPGYFPVLHERGLKKEKYDRLLGIFPRLLGLQPGL
jgi:hypothetical protein